VVKKYSPTPIFMRYYIFLIFLSLSFLLYRIPKALSAEIEVISSTPLILEVKGTASLSEPNPRVLAKKRAYRAAVEYAVGVHVRSEDIVEFGQLLRDKIYAYSEGYVKYAKLISDWQSNNLYEAIYKMEVCEGKLAKDAFLHGINVIDVYRLMGEPIIVIAIPDIIDHKRSPIHLSKIMLQDAFVSRGINIKDIEQFEFVRRRETQIYKMINDKAAMLALQQRLGADYLIYGRCDAYSRVSEKYLGADVYCYNVDFNVNIISRATARVVVSKSYEFRAKGKSCAFNKEDAARKAIRECLKLHRDEIVYALIKQAFIRIMQGRPYEIFIHGIDARHLLNLIKEIQKLPNVESIRQRSFILGNAELELVYTETTDMLINELLNLPLKLEKLEGDRICLGFINQ